MNWYYYEGLLWFKFVDQQIKIYPLFYEWNNYIREANSAYFEFNQSICTYLIKDHPNTMGIKLFCLFNQKNKHNFPYLFYLYCAKNKLYKIIFIVTHAWSP